MDTRGEVGTKGVCVPYHFNQTLDIIPNREGEWVVCRGETVVERILAVKAHRPELLVSGDCMAALACHRKELDLVWFDAHGDFHTVLTTNTGNLGGMPLAILMGLGGQELIHRCGCDVAAKAYHVGGSEFDPGEVRSMIAFGVQVVSVLDKGMVAGLGEIHLHIDTDVICTADFPSSFHPAPHGMLLNVFQEQLDLLLPKTKVLSIKTCDPRKDLGGIGEKVTLDIVRRFYESRS